MTRGLSKQQREALAAHSPTPDDILGNPKYVRELNEEITGSYNQKQAALEASKDSTLEGVTPFVFKGLDDDEDDFYKEVPMPVAKAPVIDDLDAELEKVNRVLEQEKKKRDSEAKKAEVAAPVEVQKTQEELIKEQILDLLSKSPGAPTLAQIEALKSNYGSNGIQVIALGEGDVYVFTHLRRGQWKKIQEVVGKMAQTEAFAVAGKADDLLKEKVVSRCVIYPQGTDTDKFLYNSKAGVIDTLFELIMLHSYFLTPQQAMSLTISL